MRAEEDTWITKDTGPNKAETFGRYLRLPLVVPDESLPINYCNQFCSMPCMHDLADRLQPQ